MSNDVSRSDSARDRKKIAISFYEKEHNLQPEERKQLSDFFEGQSHRMIYSFITCIGLGVAIPLGLRRFGFKNSSIPIYGLLVGSIGNGLITNRLYYNYVNDFRNRVGESSSIFATLQVIPDPINKAGFWAHYFNVSYTNPKFRMRDPSTITNTSSFFVIEDRPEIVDEDQGNAKQATTNGWNSIRSANESGNTHPSFQTSIQDDAPYDDPFKLENSSDTWGSNQELPPANIGDSYDSIFSPVLDVNSEQHQKIPLQTENDLLIQPQGASGSAWDRVRRESGR